MCFGVSKVGDYEIQEFIGKGSFSHVYKAVDANGDVYALKMIEKNLLSGQDDILRLKHEIETLRTVSHPNIIKFYDFFEVEYYYCIVEEYFYASDLFDYIIARNNLTPHSAAYIFKQIVEAVQYLHSLSIVHRDLKPQNIMIDQMMHVKIIDMGFCCNIEENALLSSFSGSPCYTPPEFIKMEAYDGRKSDMWSLGVTLYEMLTGQHPWNLNNSFVMQKQILTASYPMPSYLDEGAIDLLNKLIQINPKNRLSAEEVLSHPWIVKHTEGTVVSKGLPSLIKRSVSLDISKFDHPNTEQKMPKNMRKYIKKFRIAKVEKPSCMCIIPKSISNRNLSAFV